MTEFYKEQDIFKQKGKTKNEQNFEREKQILAFTPLTNIISLSMCDVKGRAIKINSNKWTIYLQDLSESKVRIFEQIMQGENITIETPEFIFGESHYKKNNQKIKR